MRAVLAVIIVFSALVAIANASTERVVLSSENLNVSPIQKLQSNRATVALGFRMAGIETEAASVGTKTYQKITPLSQEPDKFGQTGEEGLPELPVYSQLVGIPDQAGVRLEILSSSFQIIDDYDIMPSQPSEDADSTITPLFAKDESFYQKDEFYPSEVVTLGEPIICRNLRMIQTVVNPVQYNPVRRQLKVYTNIDYRLVYEGVDTRNIKVRHNNHISETFLPLYRQMVPNADEILADYQPIRGGYLIITPDVYPYNNFPDTMQVLARWKHLKGYSVVVTRASEINSNGSPTSQQVFNYIQNAYNTWAIPPEFICLVGDIGNGIPDYNYNGYTSDHEYSCVDGSDYFSDVMVTRMSASDMPTLRVTMRKALKYESDPFMGDPAYWTRGLSVASRDVASTRLTTLWVREQLLRYGFSRVDTEFDNSNNLPGYFNNGVSIISYRGAGNSEGWYGPYPAFLVGDLDGLSSNNKMGVMASIVCGTGNYGVPECFGEKWIRMGTLPNLLKGGPGFYGITDGDTHTKWNNPVMIGYYTALLDEGIYNLSTAAFMGKIELYNTYPRFNGAGGYVEHYFYCDNTLGDPELEIRTAIPKYLVATYPATLPLGTSMMTVHVADSLGTPLENAYVNLVKGYSPNEEVFVGGRTNSSGDITLNFNTTVADTMFVTATARDYIPHRGFTLIQAQPVAVNIDNISLDDDNFDNSSGNSDGNANPSETVEFAVTLENFGNATTATGVFATLVSTDPRINVTVPTQSYPDMAPGATAVSGEFAAHLAADIPEGEHIILQLNITSNEGSWSAALPVDIKSMMFVLANATYPGNPNNRLDPGETSQMVVNLDNRGELDGTGIIGLLSTSDTSVTITDNTADFGNIAIGGSGSNTLSPFVVQTGSQIYRGHNVNFDLQLTSSNGSVASRSFSAVIGNAESFDPVGPDNYGYYIYDNTDGLYAPSPTYNWQEISSHLGGPGTRIAFPRSTDDDAIVINNLPFNFVHYGNSFNYMLVSINGFVAFDTTRYDMRGDHWSDFDNNEIPEAGAPDGLIAPFWDDLKYDASGTNGVYKYSDILSHRYVLEWKDCYHPQAPYHHPETFEMIIYDPAYYPTPTGDAEIIFQYQTVYNDDYDGWDADAPGLYCTVGMQNLSNDDGLQYTYDNLYHPAAAVLQAGRAIKITTAIGLQQPPDIDYSPTSMTVFAPPGQIKLDTLTISNVNGGLLSFILNEFTDNGRLAISRRAQTQPENLITSAPIDHTRPRLSKTGQSEPIYPPSILNHGGPDAYGNIWVDSDDPAGPIYGWVDISGVGTPLPFVGDDDNLGPFDMGMDFPFFSDTVSSLYITANGILSFETGTNAWENVGIPNPSPPNNYISILWDDLSPQNGGSAYYYHDSANDRFIVSFANVPFYAGGGNVNFEAILFTNGRIMLEYGTLDGGSRGLNSCTVGIENSNGDDGLQIVYNADYLHSNLAIMISPPSHWLSTDILSGTLIAGHDTSVTITFDATDLPLGLYTGHLNLDSNDPDESSIEIPVSFHVSDVPPFCVYIPGDINDNGSVNGVDIVYAVNYLKGIGDPPPVDCGGICPETSPFYAAGDVNGNCAFNGIDITYFVRFLKLQVPGLLTCPDCPPGSLNMQLLESIPDLKTKPNIKAGIR